MPHKRGGVFVPGLNPGGDVGGQFLDVAVGGALQYDPELIRFQILYRLFFRSASNSSSVTSSTPGAPLFAATFLYASQTACLGMSYDLTTPTFGMFPLFLPGAAAPG